MVQPAPKLSAPQPAAPPDLDGELDRLIRMDPDDPDALYAAVLECGGRLLGMATGIVSEIQDDTYTVRAVRSALAIMVGDAFALPDTYCAEVAHTGQLVAVGEVGAEEGMCVHPVYVAMRLEAYISTPIEVDGELVGTLNFTDLTPRKGAFADWERRFVRMLGFIVGRQLEQTAAAARMADGLRSLRRSRLRLADALDRAPIGVVLLDVAGTIQRLNPAAAELVEGAVADLRGRPLLSLVHPDDREDEAERFEELAAGRRGESRFQARLMSASGRVVDVEVHGAVTLDAAGAPDGLICHLTDISNQTRLMRRLRRSQERFRQAFDHAAIAMATTRVDGQLTRVNDAFCRLLGYTKVEMLAMGFADFTHPEDLQRSRDLIDEACRTGAEQYTVEKRYLHKDGRVVRVALNVAVLRDEDGAPTGLIGQAVDVTAERAAQEQLKASELRFRLMAEQSVDLVARHSEEGVFEYVSPAVTRMLGYAAEDLVGESLYALVHPEELAAAAAAHSAVLGSGGEASYEARLRCADGSYRWVETTLVQVKVGETAELQSSSRDIGHRKVAEAELAQRAQELESANVVLAMEAGTDALTGLANRRRYSEALHEATERARAQDGPVALILIDVDHFKSYNDSFGHPAGDGVLSTIGRILRGQSRADTVPARQGGEEFAVVLPGATRVEARAVAERLRLAIAEHDFPERQVTASLGIAEIRPTALGLDVEAAADALVQAADQALYEAKRGGRNRVVYRSTGF